MGRYAHDLPTGCSGSCSPACGTGWAEVVAIVQPDTVVRWQRAGFRLFWTWKSRRHRPGRPAVAPEVRALIRRMADANPLWGSPRIHGELQKLGLEVSQATVSTVPTVLFKVLFVFVVLAHARRRVVHVNVTHTPTAEWTAQQLVEAFPWDTAPQ